MKTVTYFKIVFLLLGLLGFADLAGSNPFINFPDPKAFEGIKAVVVAPLTLTNMENVNVNPETLRASVKTHLGKEEVGFKVEESLKTGVPSVETPREGVGLLEAEIRRWETSGPLGTTLNSFAISLRFFQKARLQSSQQEAWVITWSATKSVMVGTKRTQGIEDALVELLQSFILDVKKRAEPS